MSLTFHVNILNVFILCKKLSIPEFVSFNELYKSWCSISPLHIMQLRLKVSVLSARINTSMQIFQVAVLKSFNANLGQPETIEAKTGGYI